MILDSDIQVYNYADDNLFMSSGYDYAEAVDKLAKNVARVMFWFHNNHMQANPNKFSLII